MSSVCAPASSSALRGSTSSTCSTPSVARIAIFLPLSFCSAMGSPYPAIPVDLHLLRDPVRQPLAPLALDEVERHVEAGSDAAGGDQVAVVDDAGVVLDVGAARAQIVERAVVRRGGPAVRDAGGGEQHPARAHRRDPR